MDLFSLSWSISDSNSFCTESQKWENLPTQTGMVFVQRGKSPSKGGLRFYLVPPLQRGTSNCSFWKPLGLLHRATEPATFLTPLALRTVFWDKTIHCDALHILVFGSVTSLARKENVTPSKCVIVFSYTNSDGLVHKQSVGSHLLWTGVSSLWHCWQLFCPHWSLFEMQLFQKHFIHVV